MRGRRASEGACRAALGSLGVLAERPPGHLDDGKRALRRGLRAKARQLGDMSGSVELLVGECAYAQWHRLLFSRFLAENGLLIHPDYEVPVTLAECDELAPELGEPDGWSVATRFAAEILPGIFRLDDPCVKLRLAPEGRLELERIVGCLSEGVFVADDSLGWVYQFWQRDKKDQVNASERKIGGADLGPVTQLFTEDYMVRFLLENSLGAWWAVRHPESQLLKKWKYLRFDDDGRPTAGGFEKWPDHVAELTVMDPCCGSGHFLVQAFAMLWQMRSEEEALSPVAAQDAVLRDNLYGLELDPRCVQIAMFAICAQAWKSGGGWRELPVPHIACSGLSVKASVDEWVQLAKGDERLKDALVRLHILFREADTLGSLIDPKRVVGIADPTGQQSSFQDVNWDEIVPLVTEALSREVDDPTTAVLGANATGLARAADYLSRRYNLIMTNPPFLGRAKQRDDLKQHLSMFHSLAQGDLATTIQARWSACGDVYALVLPQNWLTDTSYRSLRKETLTKRHLAMIAWLGPEAFRSMSGPFVQPVLMVEGQSNGPRQHISLLDVSASSGADAKAMALRTAEFRRVQQSAQLDNPDHRILFLPIGSSNAALLDAFANAWQGIASSDKPRFDRVFWEMPCLLEGWRYQQSTVSTTAVYGGRGAVLFWENGSGQMTEVCQPGAPFRGKEAWGRSGVVISQMGNLPATIYTGECFDNNAAVLTLSDEELLPALWAFVTSDEYCVLVRRIDRITKVTNSTLTKVPFDVERWREVAEEKYPDGLPKPWSDDPTQWLFGGRPEEATESLQVAVGRLLGYRWPGQSEADDLDELADEDGIVCLSSVLGEPAADDRLREVLAWAFSGCSPAKTRELLVAAGSKKKDLKLWLRDDFFKAHCKIFGNRPFIWHVWDGRRDGFAALINYHRLNRATLERLAFTYLGDWMERQSAGIRDEVEGADERLAAAQNLQGRLKLILEGEPPFDIYVRWKSLAEQPMGWEPNLNDGVRLNVRPFVEAGVLRSKFNVKWGKDKGKNPDGSERHNDHHFTLADKETARNRTQP